MDYKIDYLGYPWSEKQEVFMDECPAWARRRGVLNMDHWNWILGLMPMNWDHRQEAFATSGRFTLAEIEIAEKVLRNWDNMKI